VAFGAQSSYPCGIYADGRSAHANALGLAVGDPAADAFADQFPFELGHAADDAGHETALGGGEVQVARRETKATPYLIATHNWLPAGNDNCALTVMKFKCRPLGNGLGIGHGNPMQVTPPGLGQPCWPWGGGKTGNSRPASRSGVLLFGKHQPLIFDLSGFPPWKNVSSPSPALSAVDLCS